jgi:AcrR family transcriptional regulator
MYEGKNPTALRSQAWLERALVELLEDRPYAEVTVKALCERADLSRQTFYQLFSTKDELLVCCIRHQFLNLTKLPDEGDFHQMAAYYAEHIAKNKPFIRLLQERGLGHCLEDELSSALRSLADRIDPNQDARLRVLANAYLTSAITGLLLTWSTRDDVSEAELIELLHAIVTGRYYRVGDERASGTKRA